jgi:hypothetical protein
VPTSTHLKTVVEEQEGQTTLLREVEMSIMRGKGRTQVPTSTHLKVVVEEQEVQTTLVREMEMSIIRGRCRTLVPSSTNLKVVMEAQEGQTTLLREMGMSIIKDRSRSQVPTSNHLKVVMEEQEVQTTLLREVGMYAIRGWVQGPDAHQHSPECCGGGAGGADHPAEGVRHVCHQGYVQFTCPALAVKHEMLLKPGTPSLKDILMFSTQLMYFRRIAFNNWGKGQINVKGC